jgi:hypothetical protein
VSHCALNVTAHPTAEWTGQPLREAFPFDQLPRYLLRDRERIFSHDFREQVRDTPYHSLRSLHRWSMRPGNTIESVFSKKILDKDDK